MTASLMLLTDATITNSGALCLRALGRDALRFASLTYPALADRLREVSEETTKSWFAVGAECDGVPLLWRWGHNPESTGSSSR
jgi:hypothetical protein